MNVSALEKAKGVRANFKRKGDKKIFDRFANL